MTRRLAIAASILLASTAGISLAAPSPSRVSELVGPSAFHGIHGIAVAPNGKLLVGSVVGQAIYEVDPATGENHELIGPPNGMADDIAFAPDGTMAWTGFLLGKVFVRKPGGPIVEVAKGLAGANSLAFTTDGRLYVSQVFAGDALLEVDVSGKTPPRKIAEKLGGLNGFEVGKDGRIYGPLWFKGQAVAVDPSNGKIEVVAEGFKVPAAANFDSKGNLWVVDTADGSLYRVDVKTHAKARVAQLSPSLDNLAIDAKDTIYVTNMVDNSIQRVDPKTGAVKVVVKGKIAAAADLAIAHDGDTTLHLADVFSYRQVDTRSGKVTTKLRMFGDDVAYPTGVGVGPTHVVLASNTSSAVQILDRTTGKSVSMIHGFKVPVDAAETDNGQILVLELGTGSLLALDDLAGEKRHVIADGFKGPVAMAVNAEHVFVTSSDGVITRVSLGNGAKSVVATGLNDPEGIDIAPDGTLIVAEVGAKRVVAVNPDTGKVTEIAGKLAIGLPAPEGQGAAFLTTGVAVAKDGTIYVSADLTNAILKIQR